MRSLITFIGAVILAAGAPQVTDAPSDDHADPTIVEVRMIDTGGGQWRFDPASVEVHPGDLVRFIQDDIAPHNVEFRDVPAATHLGAAAMGPFLLRKGETYDVTIDDRFGLGEHTYVCTPHAPLGMVGHINVIAAER